MNRELTMKLVKRFPVLYQDFYSPMSQTCMCWGFDHGDGWFDIIWQLSLAIEDELGYSKIQQNWFLFKKQFNKLWNDAIYKISPVNRTKPAWDEKIVRKLFGEYEHISGKYRTKRMCLKKLVFFVNTGFAVNQVKEKFGTLRFYCGTNNRIQQYIRFAELLSARTCEDCGKSGKLYTEGWYRTQCEECRKNRV